MIKKIATKRRKFAVSAGSKYMTRYGRDVEILKYDFNNSKYPVVAAVSKLSGEDAILVQYRRDGTPKPMPGRKNLKGFELVDFNNIFKIESK